MTGAMDAAQIAGIAALGWVAVSLLAAVVWVLVASRARRTGRELFVERVNSGRRRDLR